jgi:hypothetical protein
MLSQDLRNFKGIAYQFDWGMVEKSPGVYDFSRIDAALAQVKAKGMYFILKFQDRTFWTGCNSDFVPGYVAREPNAKDAKVCYAKLWEPATMDNMIRVLQQIAIRYKDDPTFLGLSLEETSVAPASITSNWGKMNDYYNELKRAHVAIHSVATTLIINQYLNWPVYMDSKAFYQIADNLIAMGGGGAIGWPDSIPKDARDVTKGGLWYQVARDRNTKLMIIAGAESSALDGSLSQTEQVYDFLVNDIQAHVIIWDPWAANGGGAYLTNSVIPTVNKYKGYIKNTTCPF